MAEGELDAAGCGSMVVDLFHRTPRIINAEEKILLDSDGKSPAIEAAVGGVTLNHLGWARVLGLRTGIFGKMGDDRNGEILRAGMNRLGLEHHLTLDGRASAFAAIFLDRKGNRAIYMMRGATAELKAAEISKRHGAFIRRARIVSTEISQLPLTTVVAILSFARKHGIPTVLDVDVPPSDACPALGSKAELERALKLATYLKPAKAAAHELARAKEPRSIVEELRERYGSKAVLMTDGAKGCVLAAEGVSEQIPAFKVKQVDATGAGDAFLGGVLAAIRWDLPWHAIGRLGNAAGAVCVTRVGAFPAGFAVRKEIQKLYGAKLPQVETIADTYETAAGSAAPLKEVAKFFALALDELETLHAALDLKAVGRALAMLRAVEARGGRVQVTGVGKSEHVARYAASILCSVGTMATFLDATETLHGSLGQVAPGDVVIALSNSGNTAELCAAARAVKEHGAELIAITGGLRSELARMADLVLHAPVAKEGGMLGLAPRISVLGQVLVVAALSVSLEAARGLTLEEYSRWHRAGAIGEAARRLAANGIEPHGAGPSGIGNSQTRGTRRPPNAA
jgi:sugar/nucleoside kinase (ribokinase family)/D-arabinose 5-phosphate isomerase GutQ